MSATDAASTNSEQLLLLDDDLEICHLTQAYLERQGYTVNCVHSAEEMDAFLAKNSVDLLILDLMLPGEQGLSVAQRLRKRENLPIIIVSAQGDEVDRIVGLELGADDSVSYTHLTLPTKA